MSSVTIDVVIDGADEIVEDGEAEGRVVDGLRSGGFLGTPHFGTSTTGMM